GRLAGMRGETIADSTLNEFALMGGGDRVVRSQDFRGGEVTAIMGGFQIDLRGAAIGGDSAELEVFTLWGGVDLRVPEDWNVVVRGVPVLGVFSSSTRSAGSAVSEGRAAGKTLVVKGMSIMGGVEVKN
ncbi:MAG: cell wall-active antibiotics response protein, partial [Acidobacteriota bacterium]|nr:cell wall-active antibiotics response protein [Acidobacteriota bacterium]